MNQLVMEQPVGAASASRQVLVAALDEAVEGRGLRSSRPIDLIAFVRRL